MTADLNALLLTLSGLQMLNVKVTLNPNVAMHLLSTHGSSCQEDFLDTLYLLRATGSSFAHWDF